MPRSSGGTSCDLFHNLHVLRDKQYFQWDQLKHLKHFGFSKGLKQTSLTVRSSQVEIYPKVSPCVDSVVAVALLSVVKYVIFSLDRTDFLAEFEAVRANEIDFHLLHVSLTRSF